MLLVRFIAVTSSTSAELIAVSFLLTFDIYQTYISPRATNNELVKVSRYSIVIYALVLAACVLLHLPLIEVAMTDYYFLHQTDSAVCSTLWGSI